MKMMALAQRVVIGIFLVSISTMISIWIITCGDTQMTKVVLGPSQKVRGELTDLCNKNSLCLSELETSHMVEVSLLVETIFYLGIISGLAMLGFVTFEKSIWLALFDTSKVLLVVVFVLAALAFFFWDSFFTFFHMVFFPQGNWMFSEDSILIQLYPRKFWIGATRRMFLLVVFQLGLWMR